MNFESACLTFYVSVFRAESNESHFKFSRNHLDVAGEKDEPGQGAAHHVNQICTYLQVCHPTTDHFLVIYANTNQPLIGVKKRMHSSHIVFCKTLILSLVAGHNELYTLNYFSIHFHFLFR